MVLQWYWAGLLLVGMICALMALAVPVAFSFFAASMVGALVFLGGDTGMRQMVTGASASLTTFALVPIPLFLLMGELFFHTGVASGVFDAFDKLFGRMRGRLAYATVAGGTMFAALSGSSMANTALMGSAMAPEMRRRGYKDHMSLGPILGTGGLAIIIPPSALAVLLGSLAKVDIGKLLIAGVMPGIVLALLYVATIWLQLRIDPSAAPAYDVPPVPLGEKVKAIVLQLAPMGLVIFMVIGLMLLGIATPTESSAFGVLGVLVVATIYGKLSVPAIRKSLMGTLKTTTMVFFIIVASSSFGQILAISGATTGLVEWASSFTIPAGVMIAVVIAILIFLGCLMDQVAIMMLTVPLFYPVVQRLGFDPVWFSVIFMLTLETGLITPPFGLGLFVLQGVSPGVPFKTIVLAGVPYIACTVLLICLIAMFPAIALWLPSVIH